MSNKLLPLAVVVGLVAPPGWVVMVWQSTGLSGADTPTRAVGWPRRQRVRVLFVSVDPQRDDLTRLADYAGFFAPEVSGLTGTPEQLARVAAQYGAAFRRVDARDSTASYQRPGFQEGEFS